MSKAKAIRKLKYALDIGDKDTLIREAIDELEEEATDANGVSSVVFSLAKRIDDLEAWHNTHEDLHTVKIYRQTMGK